MSFGCEGGPARKATEKGIDSLILGPIGTDNGRMVGVFVTRM